ncbi:HAMP domain-containing sensor histidine kinase [Anaerolentibacter hominis]|uniref:sensor histidine kinase n=1 Tax=Anaerolentibacter hominis TaxID=3079009 RepID=UPI0031B83970
MRLQIFLLLILFGILSNLISSAVVTGTYFNRALEQRLSDLNNYGIMVTNSVVTSGYFSGAGGAEADKINTLITMITDMYEGRIVIVDNSLRIVKDTYGLEQNKTIISEEAINGLRGKSNTLVNEKRQYVELIIPMTTSTTEKEVVGVIIMSFSIKDIYSLQDAMRQRVQIFMVILCVIILLLAVFISSKMTRPFKQITRSLDHLTEGYMEEVKFSGGFTEMKSISAAFNKMVARLKTLEDSRQQFVSNVSHELKTPITSMKVLADSLLLQEDIPAETYREFMVDITKEIDRENKIINDLLSLVKLDRKAGSLNIAEVNINELVEQILKRLKPIAGERNIELVYESFRQVTAEIDEVKLSLAISNLIENAVKYNFDDGWVRVSLNADHKFFYIKVEDNGVGIPEDEQANIFERFYRVDKARSRDTGGTGLGLSITKNVILMHRGTLKVYSMPGEGTTFTMRVPLNFVA